MFRAFDDDDVDWVCFPWHGLTLDGTLNHPSKTVIGATLGACTGLFDMGAPAVETPPEIAAQGGEVWNKSIVNWSMSSESLLQKVSFHGDRTISRKRTNTSGEPIYPGVPLWDDANGEADFLGYFFPKLEYIGPDNYLLRLDAVEIGKNNGDLYQSVRRLTVTRDVASIGQGPDQPEFRSSRGLPINRMTSIISDFKKNKILLAIYGGSYSPGGVGNDMIVHAPPMGLLEFTFWRDPGSGLPTYDWAVIENRRSALGNPVWGFSETAAGPGQVRVAAPTEYTEGDGDCPDRTWVTRMLVGDDAKGVPPFTPGGIVYEIAKSGYRSLTMQSALLLARYGDTGEIETSRYSLTDQRGYDEADSYDAGGTVTVKHVSEKEPNGACKLVSDTTSGEIVCTQHSEYVGSIDYSMTLTDFTGAIVDTQTVTARSHFWSHTSLPSVGVTNPIEPDVGQEATLTVNGESLPLSNRVGQIINREEYKNPGFISTTSSTIMLGGILDPFALNRFSNSMGGIARRSGGIFGTCGVTACATPAGIYHADVFTEGLNSEQIQRFFTGSFNPVTGEVAIGNPDSVPSWV